MDHSTASQFVYHAVSDASMNVYPNNKPQHFKSVLPAPWSLVGDWEVGLSSITFFKHWNQLLNFPNFIIRVMVTDPKDKSSGAIDLPCQIDEKRFSSNKHLIKWVNYNLNYNLNFLLYVLGLVTVNKLSNNKHIEFELTNTDPEYVKRKVLGFAADDRRLLLRKEDRDLWRMMGFEDDVMEIKEGDIATKPFSINAHFPSLYVYCPIIEYVGVGDTRAPLLATVPIVSSEGEVHYLRWEKPLYVPVNRKKITEMEFAIKDDTGQDVQFIVGKLNMILHFRKRS